MRRDLAISDGPHRPRFRETTRQQGSGLVDEASAEHRKGARLDASGELFARARNREQPSVESLVAETVRRLKVAEALPRSLKHLERAAHPHDVVGMQARRRDLIDLRELPMERGAALARYQCAVKIADRDIRGWCVDEAIEQRADPEERSSADDRDLSSTSDVVDGRLREQRESRRVDVVERIDGVNEMMCDPRSLVSGCLLYTSDAADE